MYIFQKVFEYSSIMHDVRAVYPILILSVKNWALFVVLGQPYLTVAYA